ncbi:hypothetical protein AK812_SmicGene31121 [Symbiodinium microadriaticum]|uniref:Uncharacterized protein n=1 Tax=Symbiodinium microadriaticum TaxID=2951 RepID=A0A1Q9CXH4_SYMMI|nr:hypothetical protein AK812_SmicGene31121 [Symbiodinium microadriaticum]
MRKAGVQGAGEEAEEEEDEKDDEEADREGKVSPRELRLVALAWSPRVSRLLGATTPWAMCWHLHCGTAKDPGNFAYPLAAGAVFGSFAAGNMLGDSPPDEHIRLGVAVLSTSSVPKVLLSYAYRHLRLRRLGGSWPALGCGPATATQRQPACAVVQKPWLGHNSVSWSLMRHDLLLL